MIKSFLVVRFHFRPAMYPSQRRTLKLSYSAVVGNGLGRLRALYLKPWCLSIKSTVAKHNYSQTDKKKIFIPLVNGLGEFVFAKC